MQSRSLLEGKLTELKQFFESIIFNTKNANENIAFLFVLSIVTHSFKRMEDTQRLKLHYVAAMAHQEVFQQNLDIHRFIIGRIRWRRGARACSIAASRETTAVRNIYDQLIVELRREDPRTFKKFHYGRSFEI